jgi:hypothetical protein
LGFSTGLGFNNSARVVSDINIANNIIRTFTYII